jgi:hypothetical protein
MNEALSIPRHRPFANGGSYKSWTGVVLRFILDPRFSVDSRVVRPGPAAPFVAVNSMT